ncbi:MAG: hypothetical protein ACREHD_23240, partial [Pirellulales bacterium]
SMVVKGDSKRSWSGLWLGFILSLTITGTGLWVALTVSPAAGATIITGTVASLAGVFVVGQRARRIEREHKTGIVSGRRH